jgi:hypothetical protein
VIPIREKDIQNDIRISLNDIAIVFRANVGMYFTKDGRPVNVGLPKGFPDLFGLRKSDGKMFFIEVKNETGRLRPEQKNFQEQMKKYPVICGVARSGEEARRIIQEG